MNTWKRFCLGLAFQFIANVSNSLEDWLLRRGNFPAVVKESVCWETGDGLCGIEISNGLLSRRFVTQPAFGTVDMILNSRERGAESIFRAIEPEATFTLNDTVYTVGGLDNKSKFRAYCNRTELGASLIRAYNATTLQYISHTIGTPVALFPWTPGTRHSLNDIAWPPKGINLSVKFATKHKPLLSVTIHYEMYDDIPCMSKWLTIETTSTSSSNLVLRSVSPEVMAVNAPFGPYMSHGAHIPAKMNPLVEASTDQAHGAKCQWLDDFVNSSNRIGNETWHDEGATEPLLLCNYTVGPGVKLTPTQRFESFKVMLLGMDSFDLTRQTLSRMRRTQVLAPHTTENPLFFHATEADDDSFRHAIDQMAELGFEMLIYSFGSDFDMENKTKLHRVRRQVAYAKSKGIEVGGYDLIALQRGKKGYGANVGDEFTTITPDGELGYDACFASGWYDKLMELALDLIQGTGVTMLETDGPYGGGSCASTNHSHHQGLDDSVYQQTRLQNKFFRKMRELGVYVNQPDIYFYQGGSRTGMGYSEEQYSLPRWRDLSISRTGLYDDLYQLLPTQGWMFVPLVPYHRGGDDAAFEGHNAAFEFALAQYLGAGVAACYRGKFLYDNSTSQGMHMKRIIQKWVSFYKAYRDTLIQPVVHIKRPSMQSWDGWIHVNPWGSSLDVGLAMIFNPTGLHLQESVVLPLYYTGLDRHVRITVNNGKAVVMSVGRDYNVRVKLDMPAKSVHTIVVQRTEGLSTAATK